MPRTSIPPWVRLVDGQPMPAPWGGHPALDFCNTLAGWGGPRRQDEYLQNYRHLLVFAGGVGLLDAVSVAAIGSSLDTPSGATELSRAQSELSRARRLRAAAYSVLTRSRRIQGENGAILDADWAVVSKAVEEAASSARFVHATGGGQWVLPGDLGVKLPVLALARSLGELLASGDSSYVAYCPGDGCGWLFLDRRGRRRWCSMTVCGNRAKARRHASRTAIV